MPRGTYDLPLDRDVSTRFIPWIIALTTFVTFILTMGIIFLSSFVNHWSHSLSDQLTIQVPVSASPQERSSPEPILAYLRGQPFVKNVAIVGDKEVARLLEPWLGADFQMLHLPLPLLISVGLQLHSAVDAVSLSNALNKVYPGVIVHHHEQWHGSWLRLASTLKIVGYLTTSLVALAAVGAIIFITYTGLAVHQRIIRILQLIGAHSSYIGQQFQHNTFKLALKGVTYSLIFLLGVFMLGRWFIGHLEGKVMVFDVSFTTLLSALIIIPALVILIMTLTSRITVGYVLTRDS